MAESLDRAARRPARDPGQVTRACHDLKAAASRLKGTPGWTSPAVWRQATLSSGLPGFDLPVRLGGRACAARDMAGLFALCGSFGLDLRDVPGAGHARLLLDAQTRRFDPVLRDVAGARAIVAIAVTEPDAGSDLHALKTTAEPTGTEGYRLSGRKRYVARLAEASHVIVFAHVARPGAQRTLSAFLVPSDAGGLRRVSSGAIGLDGVSFGGVDLDAVSVSVRMRVGGEGQGFSLFVKHFAYWRTAMAAAAIGCARGAFDQTIPWLRARQAFGGPIGRFTHLQQQFAEHLGRLHMAWLLVGEAMARIDRGLPAFTDAAMAKAEAVEAALAAVDWAMRAHGARGHTFELDLEKRLRDLLCLRVADGTTDVLRGQVARATLGDDLYQRSLGRREASGGEFDIRRRRFW